jgi:hypothetical protein
VLHHTLKKQTKNPKLFLVWMSKSFGLYSIYYSLFAFAHISLACKAQCTLRQYERVDLLLLPTIMGKSPVGFGHFMGIFPLLYRCALVIGGINELSRQLFGH